MSSRVVLEVYLRSRTLLSVGTGFRKGVLSPDVITVRDEITGLPFIPGTTLKGVIRKIASQIVPGSCMSVATTGIEEPLTCGIELERGTRNELCPVCRCFGTAHLPGYIIVEDAHVVDEQKELLSKIAGHEVTYTHVSISRFLSTAERGKLWTSEYVPLGTLFKSRIICLDAESCLRMLLASLYLLSYEHIGRAGNVKVEKIKVLEGREHVLREAASIGITDILEV